MHFHSKAFFVKIQILHIIMNYFHGFFHKLIIKLIRQNNLLLIILRFYQFQSFLSDNFPVSHKGLYPLLQK